MPALPKWDCVLSTTASNQHGGGRHLQTNRRLHWWLMGALQKLTSLTRWLCCHASFWSVICVTRWLIVFRKFCMFVFVFCPHQCIQWQRFCLRARNNISVVINIQNFAMKQPIRTYDHMMNVGSVLWALSDCFVLFSFWMTDVTAEGRRQNYR